MGMISYCKSLNTNRAVSHNPQELTSSPALTYHHYVSTTMLTHWWPGLELSVTAERNTPTWRPSKARMMSAGCHLTPNHTDGSDWVTTLNRGGAPWVMTPTPGDGHRLVKPVEPVTRTGRQGNQPMPCSPVLWCSLMDDGMNIPVNQLYILFVTLVRHCLSSLILYTECICHLTPMHIYII